MKNVFLHTTTLIHSKTRQVLRDLISTNQQNEMTFVARTSKTNLKNLKTWP